ncbi:dihydrofolate reductase family protein [Microbacterium sp. cx-55]|uniref:dihydrofolate reductase family protein n=2 Tax=Microbacterium sp. cx-55 TaxID=2875948 RepID=UPI001CC0D185|nr:dihydrofolate reductase family protein [Microbacterium sp. cx-55]
MLITRMIPGPVETVDAGTDAGRAWLEAAYAPPAGPFVRLNMVTSLTGGATGSDGTSDTLTSPLDRTVLGIIRASSDVVVVGAQTVRAEKYIVPRRTRLAIVTASGRLDGLRIEAEDAGRVVVLCPADRAEAVRATVAESAIEVLPIAGDGDLTPEAIVASLADRGWTRVVCEGGPGLASQFAAAGAIDEYCVTVAPRIGASPAPFLHVQHDIAAEPRALLVDDAGFSYLRLRPRP